MTSAAIILAYIAYAGAWSFHALHLSWARSQLRIAATGLLGIGFIAHSVFLFSSWVEDGYRTLALSAHADVGAISGDTIWAFMWRAPWATWPQRLAFVGWAVAFAYLSLENKFRIRALGLFVSTLLLALLSVIGFKEAAAIHGFWPYVRDGAELGSGVAALIAALSALPLLVDPTPSRDGFTHRGVMLTLSLLSLHLLCSLLASHYGNGEPWRWPHKEAPELVPWLIYCAAMYTRLSWGWQNRVTAAFALGGGVSLLLSFVWLHAM
jgi:ABC-type transport system involved in cytochrome c biogenesis permease subunit